MVAIIGILTFSLKISPRIFPSQTAHSPSLLHGVGHSSSSYYYYYYYYQPIYSYNSIKRSTVNVYDTDSRRSVMVSSMDFKFPL